MNPLDAGFVVVWRYTVEEDRESEFVEMYGSDGGWAELFRRSPAYVRTELFKACDIPLTYLTVDYWSSEAGYRDFKGQHGSDYAALDESGAALTRGEILVGAFELPPFGKAKG